MVSLVDGFGQALETAHSEVDSVAGEQAGKV